MKLKRDRRAQTLEEAWIGDAVLTLYVRLRVLRQDQAIDGDKSMRMSSNRFLGAFGDPSEVEARIGRIYANEGLEAAFEHIQTDLMPLHEKQEAGRRLRPR